MDLCTDLLVERLLDSLNRFGAAAKEHEAALALAMANP